MRQNRTISYLLILRFLAGASCNTGNSENEESELSSLEQEHYMNPVLSGDYPDSSILRVGEDY
jgi:hypothetical protein